MSLLQKASIITTPTAYAEDYLYSIKPAIPFGDELVTNGNFYSNSDWNLDSGWSISGGKLIATSTALEATQTNVFTLNKTYEITFTIDSISSGSVKIKAGTTNGTIRTTAGTYTQVLTVSSGTSLVFDMHSSGSCVIDNVSAKEVTDADFDFDRNSTGTRVNEDYLIETVATNTPRIDYTNGEPSILLEPQRQNLITYSQDYSQWSNQTAPTVTSNFGISPEGITNADKITASSNSSAKFIGITLSTSTVHTGSVFLKNIDSTQSRVEVFASSYAEPVIEISWNGYIPSTLSSANATNIQYQEYTNNWWRVSYQFTTDSSITSYNTYIYPDRVNASKSILAFGSQLEVGSYATSLIHTSGSAVTRSADAATNAGNSDLFNDSEGVLYIEAKSTNDSTTRRISICDGSIQNRVEIEFDETVANQIKGFISSGGVTQATLTYTSIDSSEYNKIAIKYKANDFSLFYNGRKVTEDTVGSAPVGLNQLTYKRTTNVEFYGNNKMIAVFKEALTDLELEKLTGYNNHELYMNYYNRLSYLGLAEEYNVESDINNYIL